jgi:hypothetical protein
VRRRLAGLLVLPQAEPRHGSRRQHLPVRPRPQHIQRP